MALAVTKRSGGSPVRNRLLSLFRPQERAVQIARKQTAPLGFFYDGGSLTALKYRDGEFHSDFSAWSVAGSGYRELGANEDGYARAYMACTWAFRASNVFVQKIAEVLRRGAVVDKATGKEVPTHPLTTAFELAYRYYQQDVYENWLLSKVLYGESYVELVNAYPLGQHNVGVPKALRVLNALGVEPQINRGRVVGYKYEGDDGKELFTPDEIAFDKFLNPLDDTRGHGLIATALDSINIDRTIVIFTRAHLKNNARPGLIFTPKEGRLSQADVDLIQTTLREDVKGAANAGNPLLMPTAFDVTVAEPPKMDDLNTLTDEHKRRICSAIGVPVALVDYTDMAFQLSPEQNKTFYELTVIPNAEKVARVINTQILPFFDPSRSVEFKLPVDNIRAGLADPRARTEIAGMRLQAGAITLNEYRETLDLDPVPDGNVYLFPIGVQVVKRGQIGAPAPVIPLTPPVSEPTPTPPASEAAQPVPPPAKAVDPEQLVELKNWSLVASRKGRDYKFKALVLPQDVRDYVQVSLFDGDEIGDVFAAARDVLTGKAYSDTRQAFIAEMRNIIAQGQASEVSRQKFGGQVRSIVRRYALRAMRDGMREVGYNPESFSMEELAAFRQYQEEQSKYISDFGAEIFKQGITESEVAMRADMWANVTLEKARELGIALGKPDQHMMWVLGDTGEHCMDCVRLNGQVHTMKEWQESGYTPTSGKTECHSYNCLCELRPTDVPKRGDF